MEFTLTNDRKIAAHRDRYSPPRDPPHTLLLAYGDRKYEKLVRELGFVHDELKLKILLEINEDFRTSTKILLASMTSEMTKRLVEHFTDKNDEIRELASRAMVQMCRFVKTREIVVTNNYPVEIKKLITDRVKDIRRNAYNSMLQMAYEEPCAQILIELDMVRVLVDRLAREPEDEILLLIHELLRQLLLVDRGSQKLIEISFTAIRVLNSFLNHCNNDIVIATLSNFYSFSVNSEAKILLLAYPHAPPKPPFPFPEPEDQSPVVLMLKHLKTSDKGILSVLLLALNSLAQTNPGKEAILGHLPAAISLLNVPENLTFETKLNLVHLLTSMMEHDKGKEIGFEKNLKFLLRKMLESGTENDCHVNLTKYVEDCIKVLEFLP